MEVAVYCVYTGASGKPSSALPKVPDNPRFDYYFFTNNKVLFEEARVHPVWTPMWLEEETPDDNSANMACKFLKAMPHKEPILNSYDYTVYLDTKINFGEHHWGITITEEYIRDVLYETDKMRLFHHTEPRASVVDELNDALYQQRYANEEDRIRAYMAQKKTEGYREDCEEFLITGYIFRKMRDRDVEKIGEEWYEEIQKCGLECQISFHYIFQKYKEFIKAIKQKTPMTYKKTNSNLYISEKDYGGTDHVETPVIFFNQFISPEWCDKLVALNDRKGFNNGTIFGGSNFDVSQNVRTSDIAWMAPSEDVSLFDRVMDSTLKSNWWGYDIFGFTDGAQYTVYDATKDEGPHYDWHKDTGPGHHHRKLSFVILLTDGFEGGELEVSNYNGNVLKNTGSAVLFPSINYHRVKPVTSGVRKSLVFWIAGPKLR